MSTLKQTTSLRDHLLIAMPTLKDPNFKQSVAYICEHDEQGAMGVIINKPMKITLGEVLMQLHIPYKSKAVEQFPVLTGGPLGIEQGFVIHIENNKIKYSASKDVLSTLSETDEPDNMIITLGYAGWTGGQLEKEIVEDNSWLIAPATESILFHTPYEKRWRAAAALVGVDLDRLSHTVGHA